MPPTQTEPIPERLPVNNKEITPEEFLSGELETAMRVIAGLQKEVESLRGEVERAKADRNAEGVRQRSVYLPQLQKQSAALRKAKQMIDRWNLNNSQNPDDMDALQAINDCNA